MKEEKTWEEEVLSKPVGEQGRAIIARMQRLIEEARELVFQSTRPHGARLTNTNTAMRRMEKRK